MQELLEVLNKESIKRDVRGFIDERLNLITSRDLLELELADGRKSSSI